ncbi:MAG: hypothetical protein MI717_15720 [Spirochaetales bacterium]|nr:hypothetical protein [Spirochaetales bacterium]
MKWFYSVLSLLILSACSTTSREMSRFYPLNNEEAYVGAYCTGFDHVLTLVNLDDGQRITCRFDAKPLPSIVSLPAGRWAVVAVQGFAPYLGGTEHFAIQIPLLLQTIVEAEPGRVLFLGEFSYQFQSIEEKPENDTQAKVLTFTYPYEEFVADLEDYYSSEMVWVAPLKVMPALNFNP